MDARMQTPLSEEELDDLSMFLDSLPSPTAMNIEELDGFLCAIIVGPELVRPVEALPVIFGATAEEQAQQPVFETPEEAERIIALLMRQWQTIARTLADEQIYLPVLLIKEGNDARGNDWARGFLDGIDMRWDAWQRMLNNEKDAELLMPVIALGHENHPDETLRVKSPSPQEREDLLHLMTAYLVKIYRYFEPERMQQAPAASEPIVRSGPKIGRNDPCPCGSGKKHKHCCMRTLH